MTHKLFALRALRVATVLASAIYGGAAHANKISFISTAGDNAKVCTLSSPCRTLQHAIKVTPDGGEIRILDSGNFGKNATIDKSLTISGGGNTVLLGNPMTINASGVVVALRGLTLNGRDTVSDGIFVSAAATVHIEDCLVHAFTDDGIVVIGGAQVFIAGSTVRDNDAGLLAGSGTTIRISNSTFTANETGIAFGTGGIVETRQNNTIRGNTFQVRGGTLTPFAGL